jgi:transposase-like protein
MIGHGAKSDRKKDEAIVALLSQRNVEEAARAVDIAPNTLRRWLKQPEFDAAYREAKREAFSQTIARLQGASSAAASTLIKIMLDVSTPTATRVRAADCILDRAGKAMETEDTERALFCQWERHRSGRWSPICQCGSRRTAV